MTDPRTSAPSPRIIERWFPCAEVSAASGSGWGSSNSETLLMSWFAKRPLAQSRAAVLCSLLPWPEDEAEQVRVQAVLREALGACQDPDWYACRETSCEKPDCTRKSHMMTRGPRDPHAHGIIDCARQDETGGYNAARADVLKLLKEAYPDRPAEMLDPFSGRGLIPLEAARYGQQAHAVDYSPVATLASRLLIDWPFRDWSEEPQLPFDAPDEAKFDTFDPTDPQRLIYDVETVQHEIQRRCELQLNEHYPDNARGEKPWGYVWANVIPCDACGRRFPLYGSNTLRLPYPKKRDRGCSFEIDYQDGHWQVRVVSGMTDQPPTMRKVRGKKGKLAWCPRRTCGHAHELAEHKRLVAEHFGDVEMLVVSDLGDDGTKLFRIPTSAELDSAEKAESALSHLQINGLKGLPDETLTPGSSRMMAVHYGAVTFGDLFIPRQALHSATIAAEIACMAREMRGAGISDAYAAALSGYCSALFCRKLKYSTRGAFLQTNKPSRQMVNHIFVNESSIGFNYDSFEVGIGSGPGTWNSAMGVPSALSVLSQTDGRPAHVARGSALQVRTSSGAVDAVVTDPPYDAMINYSDASDLYFVWLRRALAGILPDFAMTANPRGTQENEQEIIVSHFHNVARANDHRKPERYDKLIAEAFAECRRVVAEGGVVTIVFGHGEPDVWRRILNAISNAGLMLTGAWPANTEKGGAAGSANINTTLTLTCRPAPLPRPDGRVSAVDAEMRRVISERVKAVWEPSGLSYVDQKMAAAGPALEVVGRYERILDKRGQQVDLTRYLPLARQAVTEAHDLRFDSLPLETFDQKTRFALEWARAYGRTVQAKSEARWQRLAAELEEEETEGVLQEVSKGVRLITSKEARVGPVHGLPHIEVALAAAAAWKSGTLADAAAAIRVSGVDPQDQHFWAVLNALSKALPETDDDGAAWTAMVRNREALAAGIANAEAAIAAAQQAEDARAYQNPALFEDPNTLFGQEGS